MQFLSFHKAMHPAHTESEAEQRGWLLLIPNFRGPYVNHCGSPAAQQDILDAVNWTEAQYDVDQRHVYLLGFSGGGFVSMIMAHRYPDVWAGVSEWSGISDLAAWYDEHSDDRYGATMDTCFGGSPADAPEIAQAYRDRSPISHFSPDASLPTLDLNAQRGDPIVSFRHSLRAFQAIAPGLIREEDVSTLDPDDPDLTVDPITGRKIFVRRQAGHTRLTIREGRHEMLSDAAFAWFDQLEQEK